MYNRTMKLIKL